MIMLGGRLPESENKRICQISGLKSGLGPSRNLSGGRLYERALETKRLFTKWSLTGGGRLREVVAMRELTVVKAKGLWGRVTTKTTKRKSQTKAIDKKCNIINIT